VIHLILLTFYIIRKAEEKLLCFFIAQLNVRRVSITYDTLKAG